MSVTVEVGLLSGKTVTVQADLNEHVGTLKCRAQTALGVGTGRLIDGLGSVLDACATVMEAGVQNGDRLTLHVARVQIQASGRAFVAMQGGSGVTWGDAEFDIESSAVQQQLTECAARPS